LQRQKRALRIDMLNTATAGGAAVAADRLHRGLLALGVESCLWHKPTRSGVSNDAFAGQPLDLAVPRWRHPFVSLATKVRDRRALKDRPPGLELYTMPWRGTTTCFDKSQLKGDVLHLHWVNRWLDWQSFFQSLPEQHPVVWTLHDMNPITGGCHHADLCDGFQSGCGNCPQLSARQRGMTDISSQGFELKHRAYREKNLHIVTPSRWLENQARQSLLTVDATVQTIYNGLDLKQFSPGDRGSARRELGIPEDSTVVAFGAASLGNRRKGAQEFYEAISSLPGSSKVVCLGFGDPAQMPSNSGSVDFRSTGFLRTPEELVRVYSASDFFVMPSLGENMPQTVVEAMACGIPTVAFSVGGIPEIVRPGETGLLAALQDCSELARHIQWMIDHPAERLEMGLRSRMLVCEEFDLDRQTGKYLRLYEQASQAAWFSASPEMLRSA